MIRRDIIPSYYCVFVHITKILRQSTPVTKPIRYLHKNNRLTWVDVRWGTLRRRVFMSPGPHFNLDSRSIISCM